MAETSRPDSSGLGVLKEHYERLASSWGPDGIHGSPTDPGLVYADGTGTRRAFIRPGRAGVLRGIDWDSGAPGDAPIPIDLPANTSGVSRVDWLVLRLTRSGSWPVRGGFVAGQPGSTTMPALAVGEMPVGVATVANNATSLAGGAVVRREWYLSPGGGIQCTAATMPPYVMPGVVVNQTDTGRVFVGAGIGGSLAWRQVAEPDATASCALLGSGAWAAPVNRFVRRDGWVHARMSAQRIDHAIPPGTTSDIGNIPAGFRPAVDDRSIIGQVSLNTIALCTISAAGLVSISTSVPAGINGGSTFFISTSYPAA